MHDGQQLRCGFCQRVYQMVGTARRRAKMYNRTFNITAADVFAVWPADDRCPALGVPLVSSLAPGSEANSPTLDRLDNERGYEVGNIAVISNLANRIKGRSTLDDMERITAWRRRVQTGSTGNA